MTEAHAIAGVPMRWVGPLRIPGNTATTGTQVPLATYESPLWPGVGRGARRRPPGPFRPAALRGHRRIYEIRQARSR